jgi:hypothetical protein
VGRGRILIIRNLKEVIIIPLIFRNVPDEANEVMRAGLERIASKNAFSTPRLRRAAIEKAKPPIPGEAIPLYYIGLSDISEKKDINEAKNTGWLYQLKQNDEIVANAVTIIEPNGEHLFSAINEGPLVTGIVKGIKAAEEQSQLKTEDFEVRVLIIPAIYIASLWFVGKNNKTNYIMPIEPTLEPFKLYILMPLKEFFDIVQENAKLALKFYSEDRLLGG